MKIPLLNIRRGIKGREKHNGHINFVRNGILLLILMQVFIRLHNNKTIGKYHGSSNTMGH